jgi:hypothetical protein
MTTHPTGDAPAASERVVEAVARALCSQALMNEDDALGGWIHWVGEATVAIEAYQKAMRE